MIHEKTIKREDGSRVRIYIHPDYSFWVYVCEPKKRKFKQPFDDNHYTYRCMNMKERREYEIKMYFTVATPEEVHQEKLAVWQNKKPKFLGFKEQSK